MFAARLSDDIYGALYDKDNWNRALSIVLLLIVYPLLWKLVLKDKIQALDKKLEER